MFEKFFGKPREKIEENIEKDKIEKVFKQTFVVEAELGKSLIDLVQSRNFDEIDPRITEENFPNLEKNLSFEAKIKGIIRDSFIEETEYDLKKEGLRFATLYELLEFLPQLPEFMGGIRALGSTLKENDKKFCISFLKRENKSRLFLEELGSETIKGEKRYYTPWPGSCLAIKENFDL